jgi:hypothetical protein
MGRRKLLTTILGMIGRRVGWDMSQPGAQMPVEWGFTNSTAAFSMCEQSPEKAAEGSSPVTAAFFMLT